MTNKVESFGIFNDWKYYYSRIDKDIPIIEITPDKETAVPRQLCKYYSFTAYNVKALANKYFYGSHPFDLNDPFDVNRNMLSIDREILNDVYNLLFSQLGILSMTISDVDPLMWSYYTSHFGYAVNYSINKIPKNFLGPFPINYIDDFKLSEKYSPHLQLIIACNIKFKKYWSHENEWRFILCSSDLMKLPKIFQNKLDAKNRNRKCRYFKYSGFFSVSEVILGYKLILNERNKIASNVNTGIELSTKDKLLNKFLHLLYNKNYKVSILDIDPDKYPNFTKKRVEIIPEKNNTFFLKFLVDNPK